MDFEKMLKTLKLLLIFFATIITIGFLVPKFINLNPKIENIRQTAFDNIKQKVDFKDTVRLSVGDSKLLLIPNPKIVINNIDYQRTFGVDSSIIALEIPEMEINIKLFPIFMGKIDIKNVVIKNGNLDVKLGHQLGNDLKNTNSISFTQKLQNLIGNLSLEEISEATGLQKNVQGVMTRNIDFILENSAINTTYKDYSYKLNNVNISYLNSDSLIKILGDLYVNNVYTKTEYRYSKNLSKKTTSVKFKASSSIFNIDSEYSIDGGKSKDATNVIGNGNVDISTTSLKSFARVILGSQNRFARQIDFGKELTLKFEPSNSNGLFKIKNINIESEAIKGKGEVQYNSNNIGEEKSFISVDLQKLDFDKLLAKGVSSITPFWLDEKSVNITKKALEQKDLEGVKKQGLFAFSPFRKSNFTTNIKIIETNINQISIKPFEANIITSKKGVILIDKFNFTSEDGSKFEITGVGKYNVSEPQIIGSLKSEGNRLETTLKMLGFSTKQIKKDNTLLRDFKIKSDIIIQNNNVYFENIDLTFDQNRAIGRSVILFGDGVPQFYYEFGISKLQLDSYYDYEYDVNTFLDSTSLQSKLLYLNNTGLNKQIKLGIGNLIYKDRSFKDFKINTKTRNGYLKIEELSFVYNNDKISGYLEANVATNSNPTLNLQIISQNLVYKDNISKNKTSKLDYKKLFFDFPSMEQINGSILVLADSAIINDTLVKDINIKAVILNGKIQFDTCLFNIFDGDFSVNGTVDGNRIKGINVAFSGGDINNQKLFNRLLRTNSILGKTSVSGVINGYGYEWQPFSTNLDVKTKFKSVNVEIKNFGFDNLINLTKSLIITKQISNELKNPEDIINKKDSITTFDEANGTFVMSNGDELNFRFDIKGGVDTVGSGVGNVDFKNGSVLNTSTNLTFNAGTLENRIPISIALNNKGKVGEEITKNVNVEQILKYIEQVKNLGKENITETNGE